MFEDTKLQSELSSKIYGEKVILKNSTKAYLEQFFVAIAMTVIILCFVKFTVVGLIFCLGCLTIPLFKIFNQKPKLIISKEGFVLSNGIKISWNEVEATKIEEMGSSDISSYCKLNLLLKSNKTIKVSVSDLNFSNSEISHIVEYYKSRNNTF